MERACAYCEASPLEWVAEEGLLHCVACGRSSLASGEPVDDAPAAQVRLTAPNGVRRLESRVRARGAPGESSPLPAAALGISFTVLFYLVLQAFPESMLFELFARRGWVPYGITAISSWALFLLATKVRLLRREATILDLELIRTPTPGRLRPDDAAAALNHLRELPEPAAGSFLAARLIRALRHFEARRRVVEVVEHLATEARADDLRVDASYGLVRVFVWAVPTLGFIGTVIGIGAAVGGFSETLEAASSIEGMKESIGTVTGGLGVAFDTTLLALVMSILIMFPANAVQRFEEGLLSSIDDYCAEHLVQRLEDEELAAPDADMLDQIAARLARALRSGDSG